VKYKLQDAQAPLLGEQEHACWKPSSQLL